MVRSEREKRPSISGRTEAAMSSRGCVDWLASRVVLSRTLLELKAHEALVANHPRIVTGFDHIRISRRQLDLSAILVLDGQTPCVNNAHVACLAAFGSHNGLHALRPTPPRLEGEASRRRSGHPDDLYTRLIRRARLVG
jgi:hypothetical protein